MLTPVYHVAGSTMGERALGITSHMKVMGLHDSARALSWHATITAAYLPAWVITALVWRFRIFAKTDIGLVIVVHLVTGMSLVSWTQFASAPFGRSPQLAAVFCTFLALLIAIFALVAGHVSTGGAALFTLLLPPGFFIFATRSIAGFENHQLATNAVQPDPDRHMRLLPLIIVGLVNIFLYSYLSVLWERYLYDAGGRDWFRQLFQRRRASVEHPPVDETMAISIRNLRKVYAGGVCAVEDLSLDIPRGSLSVVLGSNGAGKSTLLSCLAGLLAPTSGSVWRADKERGRIGIVPQKNVMHPELTCIQTVRLWSALKSQPGNSESRSELRTLLNDCGLEAKTNSIADTLSGGQKRRLQLAIGLVGGSTTLLVDECTSGVDPLSRRLIWRTLDHVRGERTIVFTTHFLDEADLLGDHVAILAAPGKLVTSGHPVQLKVNHADGGYVAHVSFEVLKDDELLR